MPKQGQRTRPHLDYIVNLTRLEVKILLGQIDKYWCCW